MSPDSDTAVVNKDGSISGSFPVRINTKYSIVTILCIQSSVMMESSNNSKLYREYSNYGFKNFIYFRNIVIITTY